MRYILVIIMILCTIPIIACECADFEYSGRDVRHFYHFYDKVFIGNLLENIEGTNRFEVIQGFKNCQFRDTLWGKYNSSFSIMPRENGLWIVYASNRDSTNNEIDIEICNSSRNLKSNRQYLYDGSNTNSELYNLKKEQAIKLVELSILEQFSAEQVINERFGIINRQFTPEISGEYNHKENNWLSVTAIALSIVAITMNLNQRIKQTDNNM